MSNELEAVNISELVIGDIINVSFKSSISQGLYLNKEIESLSNGIVFTKDFLGFVEENSRYYIVEKAKRKPELPTEIGSAVKQIDDWKYIRIGDNSWKGIEPTGHISKYRWTDAEVASTEWEQIA